MSTYAPRSAATDGGCLAGGSHSLRGQDFGQGLRMNGDGTFDATVFSIMPIILKRRSQDLLGGKHLTLRCLVFFLKAETL